MMDRFFKLRCNGISGSLLDFFQNYLSNRHQQVVLNGQESNWMNKEAGILQGSVLGPLLFLLYINDLTDNTLCEMRLFADDSSLIACIEGVNHTHETWSSTWEQLRHGRTNGKWFLTLILPSRQ